MIEINVNGLGKYYGAERIFKNISFCVKTGEKIGLVGPNGIGKTTVFKIISGMEDYQEGQVSLRKGLRIGYLTQMPVYKESIRVDEVLALAFDSLLKLKKQMVEYEKSLEHTRDTEQKDLLREYGEMCHTFEQQGGYEIGASINRVATGLHIPDEMRKRAYHTLSGGEKTRVELAKVLLESPDILLLDEPTNHLDMASTEWLEEFLKSYRGAVLISSHDRYFLDRVVSGIVEMHSEGTEIYSGNYSYYTIEKERRFLLEMKQYEKEQREIKRIEEQIKRYRVWGTMRDSEKMFKKAKELEKRIAKMDMMDRPVFENKKVRLKHNSISRSGKRVLEINNIEKAFGNNRVLDDVNLSLFLGNSMCITGDNGTGKSTILKIITTEALSDEGTIIQFEGKPDDVKKDRGFIKFGSKIKIGYLPQEVGFVNNDITILEYFRNRHVVPDAVARNALAKVLFVKDDVFKKLGSLSGGEKSRLMLCSLMYEKVNMLILDEPTNHLDIDSREVLEEMLVEYEGTILFVSHDRYFIAKLANRMSEMKHGQLNIYEGSYDYFRKQKEEEKELSNEEPGPDTKTGRKKLQRRMSNNSRNTSKKLLDERGKIEACIKEMESAITSVEHEMEQHKSNADKLVELYDKKTVLKSELDAKLKHWEEVSEMITAMNGQD